MRQHLWNIGNHFLLDDQVGDLPDRAICVICGANASMLFDDEDDSTCQDEAVGDCEEYPTTRHWLQVVQGHFETFHGKVPQAVLEYASENSVEVAQDDLIAAVEALTWYPHTKECDDEATAAGTELCTCGADAANDKLEALRGLLGLT